MLYYNYKMIKKNKKTVIILTILAFITVPLCIFLSDYIDLSDFISPQYVKCSNTSYFREITEDRIKDDKYLNVYNVVCTTGEISRNTYTTSRIEIKCSYSVKANNNSFRYNNYTTDYICRN